MENTSTQLHRIAESDPNGVVAAVLTLSPMDHGDGCERCFGGDIIDPVTRIYMGQCECRKPVLAAQYAKTLEAWRKEQSEKLINQLAARIDLNNTRPFKFNLAEIKGGVWFQSFESGEGKTHAAAALLLKRFQSAHRPFKWGWHKAMELLQVWSDLTADDSQIRGRARRAKMDISAERITVIDDIGKIGNITESRQAHFFAMFDAFYENGGQLFITGQTSIADFCKKIPEEQEYLRRGKIGPYHRRLKTICEEIPV